MNCLRGERTRSRVSRLPICRQGLAHIAAAARCSPIAAHLAPALPCPV